MRPTDDRYIWSDLIEALNKIVEEESSNFYGNHKRSQEDKKKTTVLMHGVEAKRQELTNRAVGGHVFSLYSASKHLRSIADNADSFTISAPHRATCWLCERGRGRILDRNAYSTPDPFTAFHFWRKSEVQDTVRDALPTTARSVLSSALLRRSISCSVLRAFRAAANQRAAPPTRRLALNACPPLTLCYTFHIGRGPAPSLTATSSAYAAFRRGVSRNPWMQQKAEHTAFPRFQDLNALVALCPKYGPFAFRSYSSNEKYFSCSHFAHKTLLAVFSPLFRAEVKRLCPSQRLQRSYWEPRACLKISAIFSPSCRLTRTPPSLQERTLNGLAYLRQHRTSCAMPASEPLGIGLSLPRDSSTRYMNVHTPPFPPPVPNSITRRAKQLVLATLYIVLGVSASRPLALTLLDASTPTARELRIHRAVAVAVARRRITALTHIEYQRSAAIPAFKGLGDTGLYRPAAADVNTSKSQHIDSVVQYWGVFARTRQ
ncbi:hypothetical protein B0H19DRAFT_1275043 [Mycena capillaripes]|nr:hypothetical protein B0H19DRAFT_1275043 [Mycena capillaripes]